MFKRIFSIPENRFNALETICTIGFAIGIALKLFQIPAHDYIIVVALCCLALLYWGTAMSTRFVETETVTMLKVIRQISFVSFAVSILSILFYLMKWATDENAKIMLLVCMGLVLVAIVLQLVKKFKYKDNSKFVDNITRAVVIEIMLAYFYLLP